MGHLRAVFSEVHMHIKFVGDPLPVASEEGNEYNFRKAIWTYICSYTRALFSTLENNQEYGQNFNMVSFLVVKIRNSLKEQHWNHDQINCGLAIGWIMTQLFGTRIY